MEVAEDKKVAEMINLRIREHGARHKIEELCLDEIPLVRFGLDSSSIVEKCMRLQHLSLCNCYLTNLNFLPMLPNLQVLELADNPLRSEHIEPVSKYLKLYSLNLAKNMIADLTWVRFLKRNRISELCLEGNPIAQQPDYRERIFKALGVDLESLDGIDRLGNAADGVSSSGESQQDEEQYSDLKEEEKESDSQEENSVSINQQSFQEPSKKQSKQEAQEKE